MWPSSAAGLLHRCRRELSKYDVSILLVEKRGGGGLGNHQGQQRIVHAGFHEEPGTLKAKYCFPKPDVPKLCEELDVCFRRNGILMVARNQEEWDIVQKYYQRGKDRGVPVELLSKEEALALEPALSSDILGALHAPEGGSVMPFELAAALMENALQNGAQLLTNSPVVAAQVEGERKVIETAEHRIEAKVVINAAGLFADDLAQMFGDDYFTIKPRKGESTLRLILKTWSPDNLPVPTKVSKGILVIPTEGNLDGPHWRQH